jgi:hypothetical protein
VLLIHNIRLLRVTSLLPLLAVAFGLEACGHTEAAPPPVSIDTVMQTVRSYGHRHQGTPAPAPSNLPDKTEEQYEVQVRTLLLEENYAELEKIAQTNRTERGRFVGGAWKNDIFFCAIACPLSLTTLEDSDFERKIKQITKWKEARPDSSAARIALAELYVNYAGLARGEDYADTVSEEQWQLFYMRTSMAKQYLLEAGELKERDPYWYSVMQWIAHNEGWNKADTRELLDLALAFEPNYYHYYRNYSYYLLPQWYGEPGELQAFAEEVAANHPEPAGSILYFQIMSTLACYNKASASRLRNADWNKLQLGYNNLAKSNGISDLNANRLAAMACIFSDKATAKEAFRHVRVREDGVWPSENTFLQARAWADSP